MAKSKKVRAYRELVKQRQTAAKRHADLMRKCEKAYSELSQQERDEYHTVIEGEETDGSDSDNKP